MSLIKKYKSLSLFLGGIILAVFLFRLPFWQNVFLGLGDFGYLGGFLAGILFVCSFTVGIGVAVLVVLTRVLMPLPLALMVGLGAALGDLIIFKLVRDNLKEEMDDIYKRIDKRQILKGILKHKYMRWFLPVLGIIMIASPFPDEIGVTMIGLSEMKKIPFVTICFLLNSLGIYLFIRIIA